MHLADPSIQYPFGDALPDAGGHLEVAPGIRWLRMGLPFALNHINLWLLRDELPDAQGQMQPGWTVVDCCIDHASSRAQWEQIFASALEGLPILRVIVTHMHPDHIGLAHWLCERWGAPLWISSTDYHVARVATYDRGNFAGEANADFYAQHGARDPAFLDHVRLRSTYYPSLVPALPSTFHRIMDGCDVQVGPHAWRCIAGYGHAPEHMALYSATLGVLISGDMVLPRISTNVSVYASEPEANPLELFLASLARYLDLPAKTLVLPSHGKPFIGLHARVHQLQAHHHARLDEVREAARGRAIGLCAADVTQFMFPRALDPHQMTFAMGEALAHLHYLWRRRELSRVQRFNGLVRFLTR